MDELSGFELLKSKIHCDCPYLQKCCCLPLRRGLLIFAYLKLISAFLLLVFGLVPLLFLVSILTVPYSIYVFLWPVLILLIIILLTDLCFSIVFVRSAHKKNWTQLKYCYYYTIFYLVALTVLIIMFLTILRLQVKSGVEWLSNEIVISTIVIYILVTCLHCYLAVLLRSAVYKFENDYNFRYVRDMNEEPVCVIET